VGFSGQHALRRGFQMTITYRDTKQFTQEDLRDLFLSVEWSSGHYPDKLVAAMKNYETVYTAWEGDRLIGLISAMDDGVMTAYIHYLLVRPEFQGKGIGKELLRQTTEHYKDYLRILLIAYDKEIDFYRHCGFETGDGKTVMYITSLWT
jgi:ribosomal protein S18 acetylase RimI-like enzyme